MTIRVGSHKQPEKVVAYLLGDRSRMILVLSHQDDPDNRMELNLSGRDAALLHAWMRPLNAPDAGDQEETPPLPYDEAHEVVEEPPVEEEQARAPRHRKTAAAVGD